MSTPKMTTLDNGLRVVTHEMPHVETASLGIWVATGARHELAGEHGISHFLEHMAFKGTARRTARDIAEEIEQVGGDLNAATSLETTAYYARVMKADVPLALDMLADILRNASFVDDELVRERDVIIQEIMASEDSPDDIAYDLLQEAAYPNQSLGRPILGTPETVSRFGADDLRTFLARRYGPGNMVVSAAGAVDHAAVVSAVDTLLGDLVGETQPPAISADYRGGVTASQKSFEQSHLVLGFEAPSYDQPDFFDGQVFTNIFGGGMSSRLFQEVREVRGLCYAIYASAWALSDTGMLTVHAATGDKMMADLSGVIADEWQRIAKDGPDDREVARAKAQIKAGVLMALESSSARAEQMARHVFAYGAPRPHEDLLVKVDAVTPERVRRFADKMIASAPTVVVVGSGEKALPFAEQAKRRFAA